MFKIKCLHNLSKPNFWRFSSRQKHKIVLGIETSCDDTCATVMNTNKDILSNVKQSQIEHGIEIGGVAPIFSEFLHSKAIHSVVLGALKQANITNFQQLSAIAVTNRPGLINSLFIGTNYAKNLCLNYNIPLIPINHMEAHALTALMQYDQYLKFPFLCLLISGGHSQIALFKSIDNIFLFGESIKAGPGELFDKISRLLKLKNLDTFFANISGGQAIEILSQIYNEEKLSNWNKFQTFLKKFIVQEKSCNFEYTRLKCIFFKMIYNLRKENISSKSNSTKNNGYNCVDIDSPLDETCEICYILLETLIDYFINRITRSLKFIELTNILDSDVKSINDIKLTRIDYIKNNGIKLPLVISGGVACNQIIKEKIKLKCLNLNTFYANSSLEVFVPEPALCTDNAIMIAWNGILKMLDDETNKRIKFQLINKEDIENLTVYSDFPLGINISCFVDKLKLI